MGGEVALEGYYLPNDRSIYSLHALMQLQLADMLGRVGAEMRAYTLAGMRAYAEHAYDADSNTLKPLWADGTDLTGYAIQRFGYYGSKGTVFKPATPSTDMMFSYATAYRLTGDTALWEVARGIARGHGLGELGATPGEGAAKARRRRGAEHGHEQYGPYRRVRPHRPP